MSSTMVMVKLWVDAVLKPMLHRSLRDGIPLAELGGALIGYGVSVLKGGGKTPDEIRAVLEDVLSGSPPEN